MCDRFCWADTDAGIVFFTREPDFDLIDVYQFSDRRVARAWLGSDFEYRAAIRT
jgi:hypothetical protein